MFEICRGYEIVSTDEVFSFGLVRFGSVRFLPLAWRDFSIPELFRVSLRIILVVLADLAYFEHCMSEV